MRVPQIHPSVYRQSLQMMAANGWFQCYPLSALTRCSYHGTSKRPRCGTCATPAGPLVTGLEMVTDTEMTRAKSLMLFLTGA